MQITVTLDLTKENLDKLKALCPDAQLPGQMSLFDSPSKSAVEQETTGADAPKTEDLKPEAPASAEAPAPEESKPVTKTDIRAVALKLSKAGKQKELAAAFAKFGCKKLSDFDSRPEDYPALMKELVSIDG